ncbi:DUF3987 domain-containing protein, partial [Escherichia coli]|uniref:DUF3987 domain-containing protein n=1 Tax=Escherichia coli TaxID=562 RepID=UPI0024909FFB
YLNLMILIKIIRGFISAESGERKTAVDKLLMEPLYQQEMLLYSRHKNELTTWKNKEELLKAQKKALLSKLNKELRKGAD